MISPIMSDRRTLLIVENEFHLLAALQAAFRVLVPPDWHCIPCRSAEDALRALDIHAVDALLADNDLPGFSGLALLTTVAAGWPAIQRCLMTGRLTPTVRAAVAVIGEVYLLEKPFSVDELQAWLATLPGAGHGE